MSRDYASNLAEILGRSSPLPVVELREDTAPRPNTVYVRAPDYDVFIDRTLHLRPRRSPASGLELPIDEFLFSLAASQGHRAVAVILSGMGSDGSRGCREIKEQGGLVLVQSPESAQFTGMPSAIIQHQIADLVDSAPRLASWLGHTVFTDAPTAAAAGSKDEAADALLAELLPLMQRATKFDFSNYRKLTLHRRIKKRMLIRQTPKPADYLALVREDQEELTVLAQGMLIGVTRFFRDPQAFARVVEEALPQLADGKTGARPLRIWVPACSSGEEAYTIAMLLDSYLRDYDRLTDFKVLASDVDPRAIRLAAEGHYPENIRADIPAAYLDRYFISQPTGYRVKGVLRERILFAVQDLLTDPPFIHIDLISCRNFLIYVTAEAQFQVLSNFHFALNPRGHLLLGPSEGLGRLQRAFATVDRRWKLFVRRAGQSLPPLPRSSRGLSDPGTKRWPDANAQEDAHASSPQSLPRTYGTSEPYSQFLAERYAPVGLIVDRSYRIRYLNGELRSLLHFPRHTADFTLSTVTNQESGAVLRAGVDTVLRPAATEEEAAPAAIEIEALDLNGVTVRARLYPILLEVTDAPLAFIELHREERHHPAAAAAAGSDGGNQDGNRIRVDEVLRQRIQLLESDLTQARQRSQRLLSELEATNEELQTSNRELLASNEEMQSTNEELQSVNEELYTVNSEIQVKNDLLKQLNTDINHLLESTEIGTLFLNHDLRIQRFTPTIRQHFDLHPSDTGRPLSAFSGNFTNLRLIEHCRKVLETNQRFEREITGRSGNNYLVRILPFHSPENEDKPGLIVTFIDIGDLVEARQRLRDMASKFQALLDYSADTIMIVDRTGRIQSSNSGLAGFNANQLRHRYLTDFIDDDSQRVRFTQALRTAFDEGRQTSELLQLNGPDPTQATNDFVEIAFIPTPEDDPSDRAALREEAMLIIRHATQRVRERNQRAALIAEFSQRKGADGQQGGLMDVNGFIIYLNSSQSSELGTEDFTQRNVREFLSPSGQRLFSTAVGRLLEGSAEEIVTYRPEDLLLPGNQDSIRVSYRPISFQGEIVFLDVTNVGEAPPTSG